MTDVVPAASEVPPPAMDRGNIRAVGERVPLTEVREGEDVRPKQVSQ